MFKLPWKGLSLSEILLNLLIGLNSVVMFLNESRSNLNTRTFMKEGSITQ